MPIKISPENTRQIKTKNTRGRNKYILKQNWIYFYLLRDDQLLNNQTLINDAGQAARNYFTNRYSPQQGHIYEKTHTPGSIKTEHSITTGAALIDAGMRRKQPNWISTGQSTILSIIAGIDNAHHGILYENMTLNPTTNQMEVANTQGKASTWRSIVEALVDAYKAGKNQGYLNKELDMKIISRQKQCDWHWKLSNTAKSQMKSRQPASGGKEGNIFTHRPDKARIVR